MPSAFMLGPKASSLRQDVPGIDDVCQVAIGKVRSISRCEFRAVYPRNGGDLGIRMTDGLSKRPAKGSDLGKNTSGIALESEDASPEILRKHNFRHFEQSFPALAFREQLNSEENFGFGDSSREELACRLLADPGCDASSGFRFHKFR